MKKDILIENEEILLFSQENKCNYGCSFKKFRLSLSSISGKSNLNKGKPDSVNNGTVL